MARDPEYGTPILGDALFGRVGRSGPLNPGSSYTASLIAPLPGVTPGNYHVIIRSDIFNNVPESNEANNLWASLDDVSVDAAVLAVDGAAATGTLANGQAAYYKFTVGAGETLRLRLDSASDTASNELYVRRGTMPTRGQFDFAHSDAFAPDQEVIIPTTEAATYYVLAYGASVGGAPAYSLSAQTIPFSIRSVEAAEVGNAGPATLEIHGARFTADTLFELLGPDGTVRRASRVILENSSLAYATFSLGGVETGLWDLRATPATGSAAVANDVLTVHEGMGSSIVSKIDGPSAVRPGRLYTFNLDYSNTGDADNLKFVGLPLKGAVEACRLSPRALT